MEKITTWKGQNIENLNREELIEALKHCALEIFRMRESLNHDRQFLFKATKLKGGI